MGYVYARLIHSGIRHFKDVPTIFKNATRKAYAELFGEEVPED